MSGTGRHRSGSRPQLHDPGERPLSRQSLHYNRSLLIMKK